jgi:hypothetical protein
MRLGTKSSNTGTTKLYIALRTQLSLMLLLHTFSWVLDSSDVHWRAPLKKSPTIMCIVQNCHFKVWCKQRRIRVHSTTMVLTSTCIRSNSNCRKRLRNTYLCKSYAWSTITFKPMMHIVEGSNRGLGMLFGELHILRLNNEMSIHSHGVSHNSIFDLRPKLSGVVKRSMHNYGFIILS